MRSTISVLFASALAGAAYARQHVVQHSQLHQQLEQPSRIAMPAKRVAIIGAGAAGASTAYHLCRFAGDAAVPVNVTIFERSSYIGGRSTTVNAYDKKSEPVELGASIFVEVNTILTNASKVFDLKLQDAGSKLPTGFDGPSLGIWNGEEFVFTQSTKGGWWDMGKLFWRYGLAPLKAQNAMKKTIGAFLTMYNDNNFPWKDLTETAEKVGLLEKTAVTGEQFLTSEGVSDLFARELVQASTRVNYAQNLGVISGLETMVCLAPQGAVSVVGGNWKIFSAMAKSAAQEIHTETAIRKVSRHGDGTYTLKARATSLSADTFDEVVIAAPFQYSGLSFEPALESPPEYIPYVSLHVTLFVSPHLLSPSFFNLPATSRVPLVVLTTLQPSEYNSTRTKPTETGKSGFFSVSLLRPVTNPSTGKEEYLYKIFSPKPVSPDFLGGLLGVSKAPRSLEEFPKGDVSWMHRKVWQSYPVEWPRVTFDKIQLADGLWYTGAMESFISTMETNALSGMNVAKLMVDKWVGGSSNTLAPNYKVSEQTIVKAKL